jgi:PAS domain S-box-containing protein
LEERVLERTNELDQAMQKLEQTRNLFEDLFATNPIPTSISNLEDGTFINVNEAYLKYFHLQAEEVIGHTSVELNLPIGPTIRSPLIARIRKDGPIHDLEMPIILPSGESRTILASLQTVTVDSKNALMLTFIDITQRVRAEKDVRTAASSLSIAEQADRHRISQILHDDLQQNIFAVKMQLSFLQDELSKTDSEVVKTDLKQIDEWLAEAIAQTRQLSIDLSPPILSEEGFVESLLWLASQMKAQYSLEVMVDSNDLQPILNEDVRAVVLQSIRELLFNVVKHSGALKANITIEEVAGHVNIVVSDQGKGFDLKSSQAQVSHGLKKMRDRLFLVGCNLKIESELNLGTRITIETPTADLTG